MICVLYVYTQMGKNQFSPPLMVRLMFNGRHIWPRPPGPEANPGHELNGAYLATLSQK